MSLGIAGTAPGVVLETGSVRRRRAARAARRAAAAVAAGGRVGAVQRVLARDDEPERRVLRFFGASESAVAKALADAGGDGDGVEVTICARDFEIHVDLIVEPAPRRAPSARAGIPGAARGVLFGRDERSVQELVLELCRGAGSDARHGGIVHGRPRRGPADVGRRARVTSSGAASSPTRTASRSAARRPAGLLATHGAVSAEVAAAMARVPASASGWTWRSR